MHAKLHRLTEERNANLRRAGGQHLATLAGRLWEAGRIDEDAYRGLAEYAGAWARWLGAIEAPRPWPRIAELVCEPDICAEGPKTAHTAASLSLAMETPEQRTKRLTAAYIGADGRLSAQGPRVRSECLYALDAPDEIGPQHVSARTCILVLTGGRELARHFGWRT